jgi:hypothetical protein
MLCVPGVAGGRREVVACGAKRAGDNDGKDRRLHIDRPPSTVPIRTDGLGNKRQPSELRLPRLGLVPAEPSKGFISVL